MKNLRYKILMFIVLLCISTTAFTQKCEQLVENGKVFKSAKEDANNKTTKTWKYRFFNGKIVDFDCEKKGVLGKQTLFLKNGVCEKEEVVSMDQDGNVVGTYRIFYVELFEENKKYEGNLAIADTYKNGIRTYSTYYHPNGEIKEIGEYLHGSRNGEWKTFYDNGVLNSIEHWINNKREGEITFYYNNGNLWSQGNYANNKQVGEWKFYDPDRKNKMVRIGRYPKKYDPKTFFYEIDEWEFYDDSGKLLRVKRFNHKTKEWEFFSASGEKINWSDD